MDNDHTELLEASRKHGWRGVHWDDRVADNRRDTRLTIEATVIGALTIVPLALSAWQFVRWLFGG